MHFKLPVVTIVIFSLFFGSSGSVNLAYAQSNSSGEYQEELEEKIKEAREKLAEKQRELEKQEEQRQKAQKELEEEQQSANNSGDGTNVQEELNKKREQAKKIERDAKDRQKQLEEWKKELIEKAKEKSQELNIAGLENYPNLKEKLSKQSDAILEKLKSKVLEKVKISIKEKLNQKAEKIVKEKLSYKLKEISVNAAKDNAREGTPGTSPSDPSSLPKSPNFSIDDLKEKLVEDADYKSELIKAKIRDIGQDEFEDLKNKYKEKIKDKANQSFQEIKPKIKLRGISDQIEDGSYYGIGGNSGNGLVSYSLRIEGQAATVSNPDILRPVLGNIAMELVSLGEDSAMLKIIGGDFEVFDSDSDEILNVWDVSVGRARVLFDKELVQLTINAVNLFGDHTYLKTQAQTEGSFPIVVGDVMTIHGDKERTNVGDGLTFEFEGTITVDDIIPIEEFEDVEADVQTSLLSDEISKEATEEYLKEIRDLVEDLLEEELSDLDSGQLRQAVNELQKQIRDQLQEEIAKNIDDEIFDKVEDVIEKTNTEVGANSQKITICHLSAADGKFHTITVSVDAVNSHMAHGDVLGKCMNQDGSNSNHPNDNESNEGSNGMNFEGGGTSSEANDEEP